MENKSFYKNIYTDLACEAREFHPSLSGVREETEEAGDIHITRITVENESAANTLGKMKGRYITLDAPDLTTRPLDLFEALSKRIASELSSLMGPLAPDATVLAIGLGNRAVTPDALGPRVIEQLFVTRHVREYMPQAFENPVRSLAAFAPGVLGITGVETMEIVRGVVEHVKPSLILAFDSLASRRAARISTTVQLTDTGISPGAGVGNQRMGLNCETFGVPVVAIGVPMVVYASTIAQDAIGLIADETGLHTDEEKLKDLAEKVIAEHMGQLIVTPKDIDVIVTDMSRTLADGVNMAIFDAHYEEVRALLA